MTHPFSPLQEVNILAKLADMQEVDYQNTLILHALIEVLIEKGVLTREELLAQAHRIDTQLQQQLPTSPFSSAFPTKTPFS